MKVLVLSPYGELLSDTICRAGDAVWTRAANAEVCDWPDADWVVSFGYKKIIQKHTLEKFQGRIINIHISLLPWNRGAAPNFWSWFDRTPKGVTIHRVDEGIDTGEVLANHIMADFDFREPATGATLFTTYNDLLVAASGLFDRSWRDIRMGRPSSVTQVDGPGSYHKAGEADKFLFRCPGQWEHTSIYEVINLGKIYSGEQ